MGNAVHSSFMSKKESFFKKTDLTDTSKVDAYFKQQSSPKPVHNETAFIPTLPEKSLDDDVISYSWLSENKGYIEDELNTLFSIFENRQLDPFLLKRRTRAHVDLEQKEQRVKEQTLLYCFYLCLMLEEFERIYRQKKEESDYRAIRNAIRNHLENKKNEQITQEELTAERILYEKIKTAIKKGLTEAANTPFHISTIRGYIGFINICRLYWTFCRLSLTTAFRLADQLHLLEKLDKVVGHHIDIDRIIHTFEAPNAVFRGLSVGLFLARLAIDLGMLIKHVCFPSKEEAHKHWKQRLWEEIYKRHCNFINDFTWASVNGLTNYAQFFHISAAAAAWITALFLTFDIGLLLWRRTLAYWEFKAKDQYYSDMLDDYKSKEDAAATLEEKLVYRHLQWTTRLTRRNAELAYETVDAQLTFYASAALLLAMGFTAALLFTPAGFILASFVMCLLGAGMYLSGNAYAKYYQCKMQLQEAQKINKEMQVDIGDVFHTEDLNYQQLTVEEKIKSLHKEYIAARNEFIWTMAKNTVIPAVMIATFAISWQAALIVVAGYVIYTAINAYLNSVEESKASQIPLIEKFDETSALVM